MNKKSRKIFFVTISGGIIGKPEILSRVAGKKIFLKKDFLRALASPSKSHFVSSYN